MKLIVYYVIFVIIGDFADYVIGLGVERLWPNATNLSLVGFLALYFLFLWLSWVLAVWATEPKHKRVAA